MKAWFCILLLLESCVFVLQQQVDGGLTEKEISQHLISENRRQNPPQTDVMGDEALANSQQSFSDVQAALRELTATVTEQKANIGALETRLREELSKKTDDRQIAFSAALMDSGEGQVGPFTTHLTLAYKNVFTNIGDAYNPVTGTFTAPLKGAYMFSISVYGYGSVSAPSTVFIMKNGERVVIAQGHQDQYKVNASNGVVLILEVGDVVYVRLWTGRRIYDNQDNHNTFSGFLLFPLR